jgi:hypothetical protein
MQQGEKYFPQPSPSPLGIEAEFPGLDPVTVAMAQAEKGDLLSKMRSEFCSGTAGDFSVSAVKGRRSACGKP